MSNIIIAVATNSIELMIGSACPVCVDVPQPTRAPSFNIPRSASNKQDILCTILRGPGEGRCLDLNSTCDGFSNTSFVSSLTICSSNTSTTDYRMCFLSIAGHMNNTKIHFFYSSSPFCSITSRRVTSRLYIDSYEIIAQGINLSCLKILSHFTTACISQIHQGPLMLLLIRPLESFALFHYQGIASRQQYTTSQSLMSQDILYQPQGTSTMGSVLQLMYHNSLLTLSVLHLTLL